MELVIVNPEGADTEAIGRVVKALNETKADWLPKGQVGLKFVDDQAMRRLNNTYAGKDEPTDVLSFVYDEEEAAGDIVISVDTAKRQAETAGTSAGDELATLLLHGVLHLAGFDHDTADKIRQMDQIQSAILSSAGVQYRNFNWEDPSA